MLEEAAAQELFDHDTTHTCAADIKGNMMAATCSGGWIPSSPVIPELGFPMGTRGQMFDLDPHRFGALAPRKRPRTTLTPSLVLQDGKPYMVFGTPGGDQQDQWTLQFFLNVVEFGMDLQAACDAATFHTDHFAASFYPREVAPASLTVEGRVGQEVRDELARLGHRLSVNGDWAHGQVCAVRIDPASGRLEGAASPRRQEAYAIGY